MSAPLAFDDALDAAIDALRAGATREQALAAAGGHAADLAGLLDTVDSLVPAPVPAPSRLGDHFAIVRAALERAQMTHSEMIPAEPAPSGHWWQKRLGLASLSIPAGLAALMLAGAAGAAGGVAVSGLGQEIAESVRPGWVSDRIGSDDHGTPAGNGSSDNPAAPGSGGVPGSEHRPQHISLSGTVSGINGNTFTLTGADGAWQVQIDAKTVVTGEVLEGATATVEGDITAEKNLHALALTATGGTPAAPQGKPEDVGTPNGPGDTGKPESTRTPPANNENAGTPQGGKPATPPANKPENAPGQSNR